MPERGPAWAGDGAARADLEVRTALLIGQQLVAVRYLEEDLAWRREEAVAVGLAAPAGPRDVTSEEEWAFPTWRLQEFDVLTSGLEFDTEAGQTFHVRYAADGPSAGVAFGAGRHPAAGGPAPVAVWDVTTRSRWVPLIGGAITAAELSWRRPSPEAALCIAAISIHLGGALAIHLTLGQSDDEGRLEPSTDSLAVLSDPAARRYAVGPYGPAAGTP